MTRDLYAVLGDLTREIATHPVSPEDDEGIEGDVIHALSRRAAIREGQRRAAKRAALVEEQRAAETWMEPLASRLWGTSWVWHVGDANGRESVEIIARGPVQYSNSSLRAERRFGDRSSGPPMISGGWPEYWSVVAWDDRFASGIAARSQPEWAAVEGSYSRAEAAGRLEARYRARLADAVFLLPPERRREARAIRERRQIVGHFAGLLQARA